MFGVTLFRKLSMGPVESIQSVIQGTGLRAEPLSNMQQGDKIAQSTSCQKYPFVIFERSSARRAPQVDPTLLGNFSVHRKQN